MSKDSPVQTKLSLVSSNVDGFQRTAKKGKLVLVSAGEDVKTVMPVTLGTGSKFTEVMSPRSQNIWPH